jgi:glycosyltransferase involved in cell wall biosynthesis
MKTILQILPSLNVGGTEYDTLDTANFLAQNGYKSIILSGGGDLINKLDKKVTHIFGKNIKSKNPLFLLQNIFLIQKIIKEYSVDIVHSRSRAPAWACFFAVKKFTNIKYVTTFHGLYKMNNWFKKLYNSSMVRCDKIIAVSEFAKEYIIKYYPDVSNKISVIHSWVDEKNSQIDHVYIDKIKHDNDIKDTDKIIFLPGRLSLSKGHQFWLKAMTKVHHDNIICMAMCGNDPLVDKLKQFAEQHNLRHRLVFIPYTNKITSLYSIANLVVCPSTKPESFGKTVVEACMLEKLVIATDLGPFKETILNEKTGWLIENGNTEMFAKKIDLALHLNDVEKNNITKNAKQYVLQNFNSHDLLLKTVQFYEN